MSLKIAIIPARGGSKRLPNKNIMPLVGQPLIVWTIEAAIESQLFDMVLVSTDSHDIADVSMNAGAAIPFIRPAELASDTATTNDVITHMVEWVEMNYSPVSRVTLLQPTSPLRTAKHIKEAMALYEEKQASAIISVCELDHPIQYCNCLPDDLSMNGFIPATLNIRSQDFKPYYRLNGAIYIFDRRFVGFLSNIYADGAFAYVMDKTSSVDIDDIIDFNYAAFLLHNETSVR